MKALLDTCVFMDQIFARQPFCNDANKIVSLAILGKLELSVLPMSFATCYYVGLRNKIPAADILSAFDRILPYLTIVQTSRVALQRAISSGWKDFEDSIQHFSAVDAMADCIVTRNKKDFTDAQIPVFTPAEFLQQAGVR